jgi:mannose-6-phosphate isomerase-like protein (cupin superfamily)
MTMGARRLEDCEVAVAGDGSILRELLHPEKMDLEIGYSLAHAKVGAGRRTKSHKLNSSEVYYIIEGQGLMHVDEETFEVNPDCVVYIPPGSRQYIENIRDSDLRFLCVVEPAWRKEDEEIIDAR